MDGEDPSGVKPLTGRTILVAGSEDRVPKLRDALLEQGASAVPFATVRIVPPEDFQPLDDALQQWASFDWIVFTSAHGVDAVVDRARTLHLNLRNTRARIAAVGPVTRAALLRNGLPADVVPKEYLTDAIAGVMGDVGGKRILLPRSRISQRSLPDGLRARGADVLQVAAYDAVLATPALGELPESGFDYVVFTSASSAENLASLIPEGDFARLLDHTPAVAIGPVTAEAARILGFRIAVVAREHTIEGLVQSLVELNAHG